jgi:hypothetical protein
MNMALQVALGATLAYAVVRTIISVLIRTTKIPPPPTPPNLSVLAEHIYQMQHNLGRMILDGHELTITNITLANSSILITAQTPGPTPAIPADSALTIFGVDGTGILQTVGFELTAIPADDVLQVTWRGVVTHIDSGPRTISFYGETDEP